MKIIRYFLLSLFSLLCVLNSSALFSRSLPEKANKINPQIDSLMALLGNDGQDTSRVIHASAICNGFWAIGSYDSALVYGNAALELALKLNYASGITSCYNNLGLIFSSWGDFTKALEYYLMALKENEKLLESAPKDDDELIKKYKNKIAANLGNIGLVYQRQDDYSKGLEYIFRTIKIYEETGNSNKLCTAYGNIGISYANMKEYDKAMDYYSRALKIAEERGNRNGIGRNLGNMGTVYKYRKEYMKALECFKKAHAIAAEIGDKNRIPIWLENMGEVYLDLGRYTESQKCLEEALAHFETLGDREGVRDANQSLSELFSKLGKHDRSLAHYKSFISARDSMANEENTKKQVRLEMNYEYEKKEAAAKAGQDKQAALAAAERQRQLMVLVLVSCVLLLVLIFAGFIFRALRITRKQKRMIEQQKQLVEEKQKEILDSIHYARRIQTALLPTDRYIEKTLKRLISNH